MEITVYIAYSVFCFLVFTLSNIRTSFDTKLLRWLSCFLFIGLGILSLKIDYQFALSTQIDVRTINSEFWQIALLVVYSMVGFFNFSLATMDAIDEKTREES